MDVITIVLIVAFALVGIGIAGAILSFKKMQKDATEYFSLAATVPKKLKEEVPDVFESEVKVEAPVEIKEGDSDSKSTNKLKKREVKKPKKDNRSKLNINIGKKLSGNSND